MKSFLVRVNLAFLILMILPFITMKISAQGKNTEIFVLGGYLINSSATVSQGTLDFDDSFAGTIGFSVPVDRAVSAEISWTMAGSKATLNRYIGGREQLTDLYIHHFQGGGIFEPQKRKKVSPFGLISLGASLFHATEDYSDEWRFSFALGGGVKINVSDRIGLRFQGRLIVPMQFAGGSIWVGSGGTGVSVGAYTSFVEGDFTGGLFFRL